MAEVDRESRTEPATPRRRNEARERGQVVKSREVSAAAELLAALIVLYAGGAAMGRALQQVCRMTLPQLSATDLSAAHALQILGDIGVTLLPTMAVFLVVILFVALAVNFAQVGFFVTTEPLTPNLGRLNPIAGVGRFFSLRSLVMLLVNAAKVAAICIVGYVTIKSLIPTFLALHLAGPGTLVTTVAGATMTLSLRIAILLAVIALADYAFQRWQHERDLRMTKQEVMDDNKLTQGDPTVKARIRRAQRAMVRQRMLANVPTADVVVRNPTHFAVALKYDVDASAAPLVVAKGADLLAQRIIDIARHHNVPVVTDQPLARALYKAVEVGAAIPPQLYRAVARILAQIFALRQRAARAAARW